MEDLAQMGATGTGDVVRMPAVCELFGVAEVTVRRWIRLGGMPAVKRSGVWYFDLDAICAWGDEKALGLRRVS
jgi:predicted site-specific integrase-resolvase